MSITVSSVTINLLQDHPRKGIIQVVGRFFGEDKNTVDKAAQAIGMTQADFVRYVMVHASRAVLADVALQRAEKVSGEKALPVVDGE